MTTQTELEDKIVELYKDAGFPCSRMDIGITVMKMSEEQRQDLIAMIDSMSARGDDASYIAGNVGHNLGGLKAEFLNGPCGFLPRSSGHAKRKDDTTAKRLKAAGVNLKAAGM